MAVAVTIDTPTVVAVNKDQFAVSVLAHFTDGATAIGDQSFSTPVFISAGSAGRSDCVRILAAQINDYKSQLVNTSTAADYMTALKTALEAKI